MHLIRNTAHAGVQAARLGRIALLLAALAVIAYLAGRQMEGNSRIYAYFICYLLISLVSIAAGRWLNYWVGDLGEKRLLEKLRTLNDDYTVIANWQPPGEKRGDVDFIVLGPHGALALECKKFSTKFGCDGDFWYTLYDSGYKKRIKSLSSQTRGHVKCIQRYLKRAGVSGSVEGLLVFSNLRLGKFENPTVRICEADDVVSTIHSLPRTGRIEAHLFSEASCHLGWAEAP